MKIVFSLEPADRSVGIMTEGFSASVDDATDFHSAGWIPRELCEAWCNLDEMSIQGQPAKFTWFSNETGDQVARPRLAELVENALLAYAEAFYEMQDAGDSHAEKSEASYEG